MLYSDKYSLGENVKTKDNIDLKTEKNRLLEIRTEMSSGQIAGTFLASLQNKQVNRHDEYLDFSRVRSHTLANTR